MELTYAGRAGIAGAMCAAALAGTPGVAADSRTGLDAHRQLVAVDRAKRIAPSYFPGFQTGCVAVTGLLADQDGSVMAGNFRDDSDDCYVWLNVRYSSALTATEL